MKPIKLEKIRLDILAYKSLCEKYGGKGNVKIILENIIDRYFHESYFDPDLVEELTRSDK